MSNDSELFPPAVNAYRRRVGELVRTLLAPYAPFGRALDFGCGDAWFAYRLQADGCAKVVLPVDVRKRERSFVPVHIYDGTRLPYRDRAFELAYGIDALHHCGDPGLSLKELMRCTGRFLLLKDHTYRSFGGKIALAMLDEIGNRKLGVPSVYRYQRGWEWFSTIEDAGFVLESLVHPAPCHRGPLGWATNALQFAGLWRRVEG